MLLVGSRGNLLCFLRRAIANFFEYASGKNLFQASGEASCTASLKAEQSASSYEQPMSLLSGLVLRHV